MGNGSIGIENLGRGPLNLDVIVTDKDGNQSIKTFEWGDSYDKGREGLPQPTIYVSKSDWTAMKEQHGDFIRKLVNGNKMHVFNRGANSDLF